MKKGNKRDSYRKILNSIVNELKYSSYDNLCWGNTMHLSFERGYRIRDLINKFQQIKKS